MSIRFYRLGLLIIFLLSTITILKAQQNATSAAGTQWVQDQMKKMSVDEKIGQLFFAAAYSNKDQKHIDELTQQIQKLHLGGIIFFQGGPQRQLAMTRHFQEISKLPLFIAMDAEWGPAMRLDSVLSWPYQMQLGALEGEEQIHQMASAIAEQLKRLGVHINFAPVVDVNSNPDNPVINHRSFGSDVMSVNKKSIAYTKGLQDNGVMAVAKHFPGHGDTDTDSHSDLPVVNRTKAEILAGEGIPYQKLIQEQLQGIMVAHILMPKIDQKYPASLSKKIVSEFLKDELGYKGLVFTDALNMKGAKSFSDKPGELEIQAILAGADVLLMPDKMTQVVQAVREAVKSGRIPMARIDASCRKILQAKFSGGLHKMQVPSSQQLIEDLNRPAFEALNESLRMNALTLLKNENAFLPVKDLKNSKPLVLYFGKNPDVFVQTLNQYESVQMIAMDQQYLATQEENLMKMMKDYSHLYLIIESTSQLASKKFGVEDYIIPSVLKYAALKPSVLVLFGNPYALKHFTSLDAFKAVILGYESSKAARSGAAQAIYGGRKLKGNLPVNISILKLRAGEGLHTYRQTRLGYSHPLLEGLDPDSLMKMDELIAEGIRLKAFPGCQVLVARNGQVVLEKSYGYSTYEKKKPVVNQDLFDLASITKITATTPLLMSAWEKGLFHLEDSLPEFIAGLDTSNKLSMRNIDVLTHQSGLVAWIPFYKTYTDNDSLFRLMFSAQADTLFPFQVADSMWVRASVHDSIFSRIVLSDTLSKTYRYSDLGFYLYKDWLEATNGLRLDALADSLFYASLGSERLTYRPLEKFPESEIIPTELDTVFRKQLIQGYVHDMGAAMQDGVGGHAGLFSNAGDLAKMMQMYLWEGAYGGLNYFRPETIRLFTSAPFLSMGNRRGLGFDKPARDNPSVSAACPSASSISYGHSGFTGTLVWVDPRFDLIFIFLSNRIHPDANNKLLINKSYRTKIQEIVYSAIY